VVGLLDTISTDPVTEGAVAAASGLVAFGYKADAGSASCGDRRARAPHRRARIHESRIARRCGCPDGIEARPAGSDAPPLSPSAFILVATDATLNDWQCCRLEDAVSAGLARVGVVPGARRSVVAAAISTGVQLTRSDRAATALAVPAVSRPSSISSRKS
jgi:D-aminopeptidase